jgi:thiol:disulfide interchange protein DsbA
MKRLLVALSVLVSATFFISSQANAQAVLWQEGKHYTIIADEITEKPEVIEFFSFWCPTCNAFQPIAAQMKASVGENVKFKPVHVNFMPFPGPDTQTAATKAMLIARALKQEDRLSAAIFDYIHKQRATVANLDDLRRVFIVNGVEPEDFDKIAASFSVNSLIKRNNRTISDYREHVNGVPNFIVNGKYQANVVGNGLTTDEMVELVVWLSEKKS